MSTVSEQVKKLGTILSVWAHPDDETFTAAGIMALAAENKQKVICVTATRGEQGVQDEARWPRANLGAIREQELLAALHELGITEHEWLNYEDGACEPHNKAAVTQLLKHIEEYKPDTVLTFGPDGLTGHPDHQAVSAWVSQAVSETEQKPVVYHAVIEECQYEEYLKTMDRELNIFFNIENPPVFASTNCELCIHLPQYICQKKCAALAKMPSQTAKMRELFDGDFMVNAFRVEAFIRVK